MWVSQNVGSMVVPSLTFDGYSAPSIFNFDGLSKFQLEPIGAQNRVVGVTFSDGSSARRTPLKPFSVYLGEVG